jgi:plasmid replication initiation protein
MTRRAPHPQTDLFIPGLSDVQLRDQRDSMERPFFSLSKRKRLTPINYVSPDGLVYVNVTPHQKYGMPTIWDADILIGLASVLNDYKKRGKNDIPRDIELRPYEFLKLIGRDTGGENARQLHEGALRLRSVDIETNLYMPDGEKPKNFGWLSEVQVYKKRRKAQDAGVQVTQYTGFVFTVSEWFYKRVLEDGALLSIDRAYFSITGGRERWLYRVVRKHAGGAGPDGISMKFTTLFQKSGAEGEYRRFKFELLKIIRRNALPGFDLLLESRAGDKEPWLLMVRKGPWPEPEEAEPTASFRPKPSAVIPQLTDLTLSLVRNNFPGLDVYAIKADFDAFLCDSNPPDDYQKAFFGFVKQRYRRLTA